MDLYHFTKKPDIDIGIYICMHLKVIYDVVNIFGGGIDIPKRSLRFISLAVALVYYLPTVVILELLDRLLCHFVPFLVD
jgi:hypothetical protein